MAPAAYQPPVPAFGDKLQVAHIGEIGRTSIGEDARKVRTRNALRTSLLQAIAAQPFEDVTIRDLTKAAGIAYATFFRHYPTKEALLEDAAASEIRRVVELVLPVHDEASARAACAALCEMITLDRERWRVLMTGSAQATIRQELLRIALPLAAKRPAPTWPPQEIRNALAVGAIVEILSWWLRQTVFIDKVKISDLLYERALAPGLVGV